MGFDSNSLKSRLVEEKSNYHSFPLLLPFSTTFFLAYSILAFFRVKRLSFFLALRASKSYLLSPAFCPASVTVIRALVICSWSFSCVTIQNLLFVGVLKDRFIPNSSQNHKRREFISEFANESQTCFAAPVSSFFSARRD